MGLAFLMSACATPQPKQPYIPGATETARSTEVRSKYFASEVRSAMTSVSSEMSRNCNQYATAKLKACFRHNILKAFDASGHGKIACDSVDEIGDYVGCVLGGNVVLAARSQLRDSQMPPMSDADWRDLGPYHHKLDKVLGQDISDLCHQTDTSLHEACVRNEFLRRFPISADHAQQCKTLTDRNDFEDCLAAGFALKILQDAISRLGDASA
jgi:hypothetical protein